jgi:hypothetical protein
MLESSVLLANSDLADTVGVIHIPSIPADSRVIGIVRVHTVRLSNTSGVASWDPGLPPSAWRGARSVKKPKPGSTGSCGLGFATVKPHRRADFRQPVRQFSLNRPYMKRFDEACHY